MTKSERKMYAQEMQRLQETWGKTIIQVDPQTLDWIPGRTGRRVLVQEEITDYFGDEGGVTYYTQKYEYMIDPSDNHTDNFRMLLRRDPLTPVDPTDGRHTNK